MKKTTKHRKRGSPTKAAGAKRRGSRPGTETRPARSQRRIAVEKGGDAKDVKSAVEAQVGPGSVDKIRDILFGNQMQDYDRRFQKLQHQLEKANADLIDETGKRLDSIEKYIRKEVETLMGRIGTEEEERTTADKEQVRELDETAKKLHALSEKVAAGQRDLHKEILDQSKSLRDELRRSHKDLAAELASAASELRKDKVERNELAALLVEVARRLSSGAPEAAKSK